MRMTIGKALLEALVILVSELVVTVLFAVVVAPILLRGTNASEVHLWVIWVTVTSPFYWLAAPQAEQLTGRNMEIRRGKW
jgi:hypothetical protein